MSSHTIGADHDSDEVVALKQALSNKDNQCVTTQNQLIQKQLELDELAKTHDDALQKLQKEADERVRLQNTLETTQRDLRDERTRRENMETSLHNTANEVKEKERATQEALAHVNQLSTKEGEHMATQAALQKENKRLVCRIEELEASNQHLSQSRNVPRPQPVLSDDRATALQQRLEELQKSHQRQTSDLRSTAERLQRAQLQATQLENEGMATQKKLREEIQHMREALEEKEEELGHLQNLSGGIEDREQQLLRRIEEEEARVQTLEFTIRHQADELKVKGNSNHLLRSAERRVESEARKVEELQSQLSRLRSDLEKAEDRVAKGDTTVHEVSSRMTQLERTHRGVMQENSNLAKRAHELEEQNNLLRQRNSSSPSDDDDTIQRLIVSIDRIRGEREEVKRQLEFLQAEHKFTQQQLDEERSSAQLNQSRSDALRVTAARTAQHLRSIRRLERQAHAFVTIFRHAQSSCEASDADARELHEQLEQLQEEHLCTIRDLQTEAQQLREELGYVQQDLADTRDELSQAQKELAETNLSFEDANTQRRELNIRLYDAQGSLNDTEHYMQDLQNQLVATKHDLESVLSERNSLHVHASNLEQEVEATKAELSEAEQRYSTLQAQQLATMSVEAIPKRLKLQIQELEERLTRRTKEKENLVHDVKRLETNMRLQEERLSEISTELETAQQENNAMIDDCAQTRDSRDHALRLVEDLEVEIDAHQVEVADLKAKIRETELSSQVSIRGLVLALANAAAKSRALTQTWRCALNGRRQAVTELSARLHLAEEENMRLLGSSTAAETRQREVASTAQRLASEGEVLRRDLLERSGELRSIVVVLALSHQHQRHQQSFVHDFRNARSAMRSRIETLQRGLDDHRTRLAATTAQLEESRRVQGESEALRTRHIELEDANTRLEHELAETKSVVDQKVDELAAHVSAHNALTDKFAELTDVHSRLRNEFDTTARTRAEETRELQDRLLAARTELESLQQSDDFDRQLADLRSEHSSALETLRLDLDRALAQTSAADASVRQATDARERIEKELASVRQEYQRQIDELTTDTRATHSLEQDLSNLRAVYDTHTAESKRVSDLANARIAELEAGLREAERLQSELQDQYQQTDRSLRTSLGELEVAKAALNEELEAKRAHIEEAASSNARWQEQIRESQATIMRLSSDANQSQLAQESLHATILERERSVADLQSRLDDLQDKLRQATHTQHEVETALSERIQRLSALETEMEAKASLERELSELKAQYDDQVSRAQQMLQDIEANDDHLMTLKKERDAHERKAMSLARKNEKLQTKLDAALAASSFAPPTAPLPVTLAPPAALVPIARPSSDQLRAPVAGPSSRPKTPEPRSAKRASVPRAKTPDAGPSSSKDATSTTGKKRPLPADFEECDNVPPQAFTPDSIPMGSRTRVASGHRNGFTPVRRHPGHDTASPPRAPNILDVTNSPSKTTRDTATREDKKRGWLPRSRAPEPPASRSTGPRR